jgi:chromosome segregation ATPase
MDTFTERIQGLQAEISQTDDRITASHVLIDRLGPEVKELETALKEAKKVVALDPSSDNRRAVETLRKKLDKATNDLDEAVILAEALTDRKQQLELQLADTKKTLAKSEVEILSDKAQELVAEYSECIHRSFNAALRLKLISQMVQSRKGSVNFGGDPHGVFQGVFDGFPVFGSNGGYPVTLRQAFVQQAEIEKIMTELLTV